MQKEIEPIQLVCAFAADNLSPACVDLELLGASESDDRKEGSVCERCGAS